MSGPTLRVLCLTRIPRWMERRVLEKALTRSGGNRTVAACILGISRRTLYYKLEEHGLGGVKGEGRA